MTIVELEVVRLCKVIAVGEFIPPPASANKNGENPVVSPAAKV
jgi:hypothetical protein